LPGWQEKEAEKAARGTFAGKLSSLEEDTIKEVGNISLGSAATILSQLVSRRVKITTPRLSYTTIAEIKAQFPAPCLVVEVAYVNGLAGKNLLVIAAKDAQIISRLMMQEDPRESGEMDEIHLSAVGEAMNQMMGSAATAMSDMFDRKISISPPRVEFRDVGMSLEEARLLEDDVEKFAQVSFRIEVEDLIDSEIIQIIPLKFAVEMTGYLLNRYQLDEGGDLEKGEEGKPVLPEPENNLQDISTETEAYPGEPAGEKGFNLLPEAGGLELVKDISVQIEGVIGKVRKPLSEILALSKGSLVEMDTNIGQPVDILANGKLVARAEIVAIREHFGLKLTEIVFK